MAPKRKKKDLFYVHNRYRDGLYIPHRKRTYLYWFKFLQEAERSPDYEVDWSKYRKWGGRKAVMNSKFDDWWEEHWKSLFGMKERNGTPKVELSTKSPKTETIRMTWLVWMYRDTPPDYVSRRSRYGGGTQYKKRGANNLAIARRIIATEKRRATYTAPIDPDDPTNVNDDQAISGLILRYKKRGRIITENVCKGIFP